MKRVERLYASVVLVCFLGGVAGCKHQDAADAPSAPATKNIGVEAVHWSDTTSVLRVPGRVEPDPAQLVHVYAPLSGQLVALSLVPGQEVRKGQAIATLRSGDVAQARADYEKAHIEVLRADRALERGKTLAAHEVLSQADLQELLAVDETAHSEQERARQRIHELGFSESGTSDSISLKAPISGTVLETGTAAGEMQRSLETANGIATIANLDHVWITGDIYENDLHSLHLHQNVTITFSAYPGEEFHGSVVNIGDTFDPTTHAAKVRVVLPNPQHRLKPAMFATIAVAGAPQRQLLLPEASVLHEGDATIVYVEQGAGHYEPQRVQTGATHGANVEVLSGLQDGARVVVRGAAFLRQPAGE